MKYCLLEQSLMMYKYQFEYVWLITDRIENFLTVLSQLYVPGIITLPLISLFMIYSQRLSK